MGAVNDLTRRRPRRSHFFTKLREGDSRGKLTPDSEKAQRAHARVERWTRGVDVFAKKFLLVPVVEDLHWSLAIVCHPGELAKRAIARQQRELDVDATVDEAEDEDFPARPCVIHMNSNLLRKHSAKKNDVAGAVELMEEVVRLGGIPSFDGEQRLATLRRKLARNP